MLTWGVELPNFSYDAPVNNSNIVPVGGDRKRQPTTTILHEVYVIPGERVDLIPYTDITRTSKYFEDFYRFYDYKTDKAHEDVYFLHNPKAGAYNKYGIFGGKGLGYVFNGDGHKYGSYAWEDNQGQESRGAGGVASFYRPASDNRPIDEYIAADFSQHYYLDGSLDNKSREEDFKKFLDKDSKIIHEPIIKFRHVFHVIDGRTLANEMSANREANNAYVAKSRRHISARARELLAIRLINATPDEEGVKANFYYKKRTVRTPEWVNTTSKPTATKMAKPLARTYQICSDLMNALPITLRISISKLNLIRKVLILKPRPG